MNFTKQLKYRSMKKTVTKEDVQKCMTNVQTQTIMEFDKPTTVVSVRLPNGFIIHETTTCVDPANYDEQVGRKVCLEKIEDKVWFLLGYDLQSELYNSKDELKATAYQMLSTDYKERFKAEYQQLFIRYTRLSKMLALWEEGKLSFTPTCPRYIYTAQISTMRSYLDILERRAAMEGIKLC